MRWVEQHVVGVVACLAVGFVALAAVAGWFVLSVLPAIRGEVDHAADRADAAFSKGTSLEVRVDGIDGTLDRVDATLAQATGDAASTLAQAAGAVRLIKDLVASVPATAGAAADAALAPFRAAFGDLVAKARGLLDATNAAVLHAQVGADVGVGVSGRVDVVVHVLGPALEEATRAFGILVDGACANLGVCL